MFIRKTILAVVAAIALVVPLAGVSGVASAQTLCTTSAVNGTCGPYSGTKIPMADGYDTYVSRQSVDEQTGTTGTLNSYTPSDWSVTENAEPYGFTGVQDFVNVQQLTNDWNGSGWGGTDGTQNTPLSALSTLRVEYTEKSPTDANSVYEYAPDVWDTSAPADVMFWADTSPLRCTDNGLNTSDILGQARLGTQQWTVYHYGAETIFILDGTSSTDPVTTGTCAQQTSGSIHILQGFKWLVANGVIASLGDLTQLNTGWEITSADNTTFSVSRYNIEATVG